MVGVQVAVPAGPDELARLQVADLCHHQRQQRVAGDVERYAQEDISRALIELTAQLAVCHIELEQRMTGRQRHLIDQRRVPGRHDKAA